MKNLFVILLLLSLGVGCSQSKNASSSGTTTTTATTHQYGISGNACYDYTAGSYVDLSYCSSTSSGLTYSYVNGLCYASNGVQVATGYCTSTSTTNTSGVCYGNYIYNQNGYMQYGVCYGSNCRGYTLIEVSTGRTVTCQ